MFRFFTASLGWGFGFLFLSLLAADLFPLGAAAQNCRGKVLYAVNIKPFGSQGNTYHYIAGDDLSEIRSHRASFFGNPSYYTAQGIGPIPAKAIKLLNCHPVFHPSEGFFDPGYDLIPNDWTEIKGDKQLPKSPEIDYSPSVSELSAKPAP